MTLDVHPTAGRTSFLPGEEITGVVCWSLPQPARHIELQLLWTTRGKGIVDTKVVESVHFENPAAQAEHPFRLRLPEGPYSFRGTLVSLLWAIRLIAEPAGDQAQVPITVSPNGREIDLISR
jgi:hypothetical protein